MPLALAGAAVAAGGRLWEGGSVEEGVAVVGVEVGVACGGGGVSLSCVQPYCWCCPHCHLWSLSVLPCPPCGSVKKDVLFLHQMNEWYAIKSNSNFHTTSLSTVGPLQAQTW